jgi:hypothetical protein
MTSAYDLLGKLEAQSIELWVSGDRLKYRAKKGSVDIAILKVIEENKVDLIELIRVEEKQKLKRRYNAFLKSFTELELSIQSSSNQHEEFLKHETTWRSLGQELSSILNKFEGRYAQEEAINGFLLQ